MKSVTSFRDRNSIVPILFRRLLACAGTAVLVHFWASYLNDSLFVFCFLFDDYYSLTVLYLRTGILCLSLKKKMLCLSSYDVPKRMYLE